MTGTVKKKKKKKKAARRSDVAVRYLQGARVAQIAKPANVGCIADSVCLV
jgi:hypothetical protein